MLSILLALILTSTAQVDAEIDGPTLFALFHRYHASIGDVSFIHEGTLEMEKKGTDKPEPRGSFQTFYAYRSDGATLLDVFGTQPGRPTGRVVSTLLHGRLELLDASPDEETPIRNRAAESGPGGPGSMARYNSPERIFLAWYFPTLGEPGEHDFKVLGWEEVGGRRCLKVSFLKQPKALLKNWVGGLPYYRMWVDLQRDGYPIRYESLRGEKIEARGEITRMEQLELPNKKPIWMPVQGISWGFHGKGAPGRLTIKDSPTSIDKHTILINTVKFNQGLSDAFFSVRKHSLVASEEDLRKLQREMESDFQVDLKARRRAAASDDPSKRLDDALVKAEEQSKMLEASSAARAGAGWGEFAVWSMGILGVVLVSLGGLIFWRSR